MPTPTYDLHSLGWASFQDLSLAIARQILGQTVERFPETHDRGRDGAFKGTWQRQNGETLSGNFVLQCKHTSTPNATMPPSALSDDIAKAKRLVSESLCDCYILMTNARIIESSAATIENNLRAAGVRHSLILDGTTIRDHIRLNPKLRTMVPRVYGLGDLSQILDARANDQTRAILQSLQTDLETIVNTNAYHRAVTALEDHSLVILLGAPAAGKTTIASQLTMAALDQWGAQTYKLDSPTELRQHWNTHEEDQFFFIDDAFGTTQYNTHLAENWNRELPRLRSMLKDGVKIVLTSRDYIYQRALKDLKTSELPLLTEAEVAIDVQDLSLAEKEQMLYNHIKLGSQPHDFRRRIKRLLPAVATNPHFMPELARRLGNPQFTGTLKLNSLSIAKFIQEPEAFLEETINDLDDDSRAALVLLFMHGGSLDGYLNLDSTSQNALSRLNSSVGGCRGALIAMEGGLVSSLPPPSGPRWEFRHPTLKDAASAYLEKRRDLVDILVEGSDPVRLMAQVTCGDVGLEKAVIIPEALFDVMIGKIDYALYGSDHVATDRFGWSHRERIFSFLARRCSIEFLQRYVAHYPMILDILVVTVESLHNDPGAMLASRLFDVNLLPEVKRAEIVDSVTRPAIGEDTFWQIDVAELKTGHLANLISATELDYLEETLRASVIPMIDDIRDSWDFDYDGDEADSYMEPLQSYCHSAKQFFEGDQDTVSEIESQEMWIDDWISEHYVENPMDDWKVHAEREYNATEESERSIFDDIDE